jgi:hypothetical protein
MLFKKYLVGQGEKMIVVVQYDKKENYPVIRYPGDRIIVLSGYPAIR